MNENASKIATGIFIILIGWYIIAQYKKNNENMYYIDNKPHQICGKSIYITDFTYDNELNISELLDEIEHICK